MFLVCFVTQVLSTLTVWTSTPALSPKVVAGISTAMQKGLDALAELEECGIFPS